jgi:Domain of unknown function (DUF4291)
VNDPQDIRAARRFSGIVKYGPEQLASKPAASPAMVDQDCTLRDRRKGKCFIMVNDIPFSDSQASKPTGDQTPFRQIRALQTASTITVYQAYPSDIADRALEANRFVAPFKMNRMTWIKPSFLWMAYRCGWGAKPGQERVLAIEITKTGFTWALEHSCLSHFEPEVYESEEAWAARMAISPVRIQWDPERDLHHRPLDHRSIQIGISGDAVAEYVNHWIVNIEDRTPICSTIGDLVAENNLPRAHELLPKETPFVLNDGLAKVVGATT